MLFVVSRSKRRVALVIVLFAAFVAACLGIDPHLSSTSQLAVVINPGSADFGDVTVGVTSQPIDIVISPAGTADQMDTVMGGSDSCGTGSPFKVTGPFPAPVSRTCTGSGTGTTFTEASNGTTGTCTTVTATYQATFTPQAPGMQSCTFTFFGTFGSIPVTLSGNGVAPVMPQIAVTPGTINFGDIRVTTTSPPTNITISNVGGQVLQITSIVHTDLTTFSVGGNNGPHGLNPGAFEQHPVTCTPNQVRAFSDTVVITSNAANTPTVNVGLTCNGTDAAISMTGNPPDLLTRVGDPKNQTITLKNEGTATSTITAINLASGVGAHLTKVSGPPVPLGLGSGSTADVVVHYDAAVPQDFGELGRLQVTADGKNIEFVINGGALSTSLGLNPDSVDFGPICAGKQASMPVAVFASAQGDVQINSTTTPSAPFGFMPGQTLPATAKGNHGNDVMFTASVNPAAAGALDATATLDTDLPGANMRDITLHAVALPAGVTATPSMLDFGTIAENLVAPAQSVDLTNCNTADLQITGAHIEGAAPGEFAIVSQDVAGTVAPASSKQVLVVMTPHSAGPKLAVLVIEHGENSFVDLVGNGEGGAGGDDEDRVTYYRCNAGGPVGLAPLALVLLALRRRRR
jgi:uncharacterized protein (TIGR03382 family)